MRVALLVPSTNLPSGPQPKYQQSITKQTKTIKRKLVNI